MREKQTSIDKWQTIVVVISQFDQCIFGKYINENISQGTTAADVLAVAVDSIKRC